MTVNLEVKLETLLKMLMDTTDAYKQSVDRDANFSTRKKIRMEIKMLQREIENVKTLHMQQLHQTAISNEQ